MNENNWLEQLSSREEQGFKYLYEKQYSKLHSFASKYIEDEDEAKDVVQDVLLDLWRNTITFTQELTLKSYLYTSVRNKCLDKLKHQKVKTKYLNSLKEESSFFLTQILEEEVYEQLRIAIKELPPPVNEIYELTLLGKTNKEIAEELDLTIDAVKSHKKRGKKALQTKLQHFLYILLFRK